MRLICPSCAAQYEVPAEVIPETGRDVQCSECGDTWFQHHPDHPPESAVAGTDPEVEEEALEHVDEYSAEPEADTEPTQEPQSEIEPESEPEQNKETKTSEDTDEDDDDLEQRELAPPEAPRRELDEDIATLLREEAERESRARQSESQAGLETQTELGLEQNDPAPDQRSEESKARMARLRGKPDAASAMAPSVDDNLEIDPASRSNLLPDIEEINSSLAPEGEQSKSSVSAAVAHATKQEEKSSFRLGFRIAIIVALLFLMAYIFAPKISNAVPNLAGPLTDYVETVNSARAALQQVMSGFVKGQN
ncbi:MAG: zinc-ribbon domain-containing protein [Pseudomonadota bacterium]